MRFKYNLSFEVTENSEDELKIDFLVNLMTLVKITLLLLVFIAMFSTSGVSNFLVFSGIFLVVFYFSNVLFISSFLRKIVKGSLEIAGYQEDSTYNIEQVNWINSPDKCSACGGNISKEDVNCPSCDLRLRDNPYTTTMKLDAFSDPKIKYHYNKENEKDIS